MVLQLQASIFQIDTQGRHQHDSDDDHGDDGQPDLVAPVPGDDELLGFQVALFVKNRHHADELAFDQAGRVGQDTDGGALPLDEEESVVVDLADHGFVVPGYGPSVVGVGIPKAFVQGQDRVGARAVECEEDQEDWDGDEADDADFHGCSNLFGFLRIRI